MCYCFQQNRLLLLTAQSYTTSTVIALPSEKSIQEKENMAAPMGPHICDSQTGKPETGQGFCCCVESTNFYKNKNGKRVVLARSPKVAPELAQRFHIGKLSTTSFKFPGTVRCRSVHRDKGDRHCCSTSILPKFGHKQAKAKNIYCRKARQNLLCEFPKHLVWAFSLVVSFHSFPPHFVEHCHENEVHNFTHSED